MAPKDSVMRPISKASVKKTFASHDFVEVWTELIVKFVNQHGPRRGRIFSALLLAFSVNSFAAELSVATASDEVLARAACSACHLFPDPRLLDKTIWPAHIFPKMRLYMGLDKVDASASKDAELLSKAGYFPIAPMVPESSWQRITNWYQRNAPEPTNTPS